MAVCIVPLFVISMASELSVLADRIILVEFLLDAMVPHSVIILLPAHMWDVATNALW